MKANHERIVNILSANEDSFSKEVLALVMECMDENESLRQQKDSLAAYIKEREAETKSPIKVILVGNKDRKRIECKHCTSILEFDKIKDVEEKVDVSIHYFNIFGWFGRKQKYAERRERRYKYITCPVCNCENFIENTLMTQEKENVK